MCSYASFDIKELGNKEFLRTSPIIPDFPETSLSQYPIKPSQSSIHSDQDEQAHNFNRKLHGSSLQGTEALRSLMKDVGSRRGNDDVIIDIKEHSEYPRRNQSRLPDRRPPRINDDEIPLQSSDYTPPLSGSVKSSKNGKMEFSLLNFKSNYPKWTPLQDIDQFLGDMNSSYS